uniref:NACHT, LRR and PYD domains-containing protein 14-like n=1 Tax=Phallusia mammillata TaxID=59560 RepID=A0A6F9DLP6_9ASCI|nr:NACHT, LRR and PYD domains-containing protein 14-like [Phallusia mammillata]
MSSRALRKLQGRGDVMSIAKLHSESSEEEDVVEAPSVNKFALLNDENEYSNDESHEVLESPAKSAVHTTSNQSAVKKRNKKKKRKNNQDTKIKDTINEDIDKLLEVIEETKASSSKVPLNSTTDSNAKALRSVLTVEHRFLNPDNELRKIFGSRALMEDASYRRRNQAKSNRGVWLTQPQNNWVKLGRTGITMNLIETKNGVQYFKYEHSRDYQDVQFKFLDAVETSDHRNIASVLERHTYHVDSLVTFSDVYKVHDDIKMARELIERALYCLERSFHPCFNLTTGLCRLDYKYPENRCLFLALYKHMNFVAQRGCNRTALELAKVLLSLDSDNDPLGVSLLLDYFALRAAEYKFMIRFAQEWGASRNLPQLPNWAYSIALAHFHLNQEGDLVKADKCLQDALIMFPSVLLALLDKCSVQPDKKVTACPHFKTTESSPAGLSILCHLYVGRCYLMWKAPDVMTWLERNVNVAMQRVNDKEPLVIDSERKRKTRYQKPPLNVYRHAMISEIDGVSSLLPLDIRMGTMLSHDPLPPSDTVTSYTRPPRSSSGRRVNPVSLFFHSLLPGFNPEDPLVLPEPNAVDGEQGEVRGNVQTLMNAMRELLHTFQQPLDGDAEEAEFDEEWD